MSKRFGLTRDAERAVLSQHVLHQVQREDHVARGPLATRDGGRPVARGRREDVQTGQSN